MTTSPVIDLGDLRPPAARIGRVAKSSGRHVHSTRFDAVGPVGQISVITASSGTNTETYSVRFRGPEGLDETVSAVATADSAAGVAAPLLAAIQANELVAAYAKTIAAQSTDAVRIEWQPGLETVTVSFPTNPSTHLSNANTDPTAAPQYKWATAVEVVSHTAPRAMLGEGVQPVEQPDGAVIDVTQTHDALGDSFVRLLVDGRIEDVEWEHGGGAAATDTAAKTAFEAFDFIASATIESTGVITVVGVSGIDISVVSATATGGSAATAATLNTQAEPVPTLALVLDDHATPTLDAIPQTQPEGPVPGSGVLTADPSGGSTLYAVPAPSASLAGSKVYVETDTGSEGVLLDVPTATSMYWAEATFYGLDPRNPNIALIRL